MISSYYIHVPMFKTSSSGTYSYGNTYKGILTNEMGVRFPVFVNLNVGSAFAIALYYGTQWIQTLFYASWVDN